MSNSQRVRGPSFLYRSLAVFCCCIVLAMSVFSFRARAAVNGILLTSSWQTVLSCKQNNNQRTIRAYSSSSGVYTIALINSQEYPNRLVQIVMSTSADSPYHWGDSINDIPDTVSNSTTYGIYYDIMLTYLNYSDITTPYIDCQGQSYVAIIDQIYDYTAGIEVSSAYLSIDLPAGNAIVIEVAGGSNQLQLQTTSYDPYYTPTSGLNRISLTWAHEIPSMISDPMRGNIQWTGIGKPNLLNMYTDWENTEDLALDIEADKYLIIINPMIDGYSTTDQVYNPWVQVTVEKVISYNIYPLNTQISSSGLTSTNNGSTVYTGSYDPDTGEWTTVDSDGNPVTPQTGGQSAISTATDSVQGWLKNIATTISGFFRGSIDAIKIIANAIGEFANSLKSLYMWLPSPVMAIVTSAIMLSLTIGVIKVFL